MSAAPPMPSLADRLKSVVVTLRGELDISRHLFRSGPAYIVRDPVTFATHRFDPEDYRILNAIDREKTLGETFERLVTQGVLEVADEEDYYAFILELHQRNLLSLPVSDGDTLFKRFEKRRNAERLSKLLGVFFLRVPLINPDRLLTRTLPAFRWLFSLPALLLWFALAGASTFIAIARWDDLSAPVLTVFDGGNIYMLWSVLIGLKVIHEFGHAYACKVYGGHVPEMGAFFILFTPLAYVDATDSWTFTKTRHRAIVTLGGVYFESIIGGIAMIVWALTEPGTMNTLAYQVVLLATVTTALFNLNPLLRYDAYYLVSDLAGVPNLRARCQEAVASLFKKVLFGIRTDVQGFSLEHHPGLVLFGLAQIAYKLTVMVTITTVLIMKFAGAGLVMGLLLLGMTVSKALLSLFRYIAGADEAQGHRLRASTVSIGGTLALLAVALLVPAPWPVEARGVASFASIETLHAPSDGLIDDIAVEPGEVVTAGQPIMRLSNARLSAEHRALLAQRAVGEVELIKASAESRTDALVARANGGAINANIARLDADLRALTIDAARTVHVLELYQPAEGVRVKAGDPLARIASGKLEAVFLLQTYQYESLRLSVGDEIECRTPLDAERRVYATVTSIAAVGSKTLDDRVRNIADVLKIPTNPNTGEAAEPYFEIRLRIDEGDTLHANSTLIARFPSAHQTTARIIERRFTRFMNRVNEGFSAK